MEPEKLITIPQRYLSVQDIYDKYAGMLLGFMVDGVRDRQLAEQYLVDFFAALPQHLQAINKGDKTVWISLQHLAKKQLATMDTGYTNKAIGIQPKNDLLDQMTADQRTVFLSTYYYGKTVAQLANELRTTEDVVRKVLKEVFIIIRKGS